MLSEIEPSHCRYNNALTIAHPKDPTSNRRSSSAASILCQPETPKDARERERVCVCENYVYGAARGKILGFFVSQAQSTSSSSLPRAYQNL